VTATPTAATPERRSAGLPRQTLLLALAYLGFVSLGLPDAVLGVAWPSLRGEFGLPQSGLGLVLAGFAAGFFLSSSSAGRLLQRLGVGALLAASTALVALALFGYGLTPSWSLFLLAAAVLGLGSGAIDAGLNAYAAGHFSPRHMNWLHAAYGLGASLGPFVMTGAIAAGLTWRGGYLLLALVLTGMACLFVATRGRWQGDVRLDGSTSGASLPAGRVLRRPLVWLQILIFFVYTGAELTAGQWAFALLTEARGMAPTPAGIWAGLFWVAMFAGRVSLGFVADRLGPDRLVRLGTVGGLIGALALALAPTPVGLAGLVLLGFSLAPIYPMLMSRTPARLGGEAALHAVGFQVSAAMLGAFALPSLAGLAADRVGLEAAAAIVAASAAAVLVLHEILLRVGGRVGR
jgi:fucose permease